MDISVPSRFACLKIEDDEFRPVSTKTNKKKPVDKVAPAKKAANSTSQQKRATNTNNSSSNVKQQPGSKKAKKGKTEEKQWEDWKRKDDELVDDNFEEDLKCAILQSKLDFEKQKKNAPAKPKPDETHGGKKKKGKTTMSLDQFLDKAPQESDQKDDKDEQNKANFFEEVLENAKSEITKEKVEESRRKRNENMEKIITLAQCQEKLEKEILKNAKLCEELSQAKKEIALVKKRNTTLCSMLSQGEMKGKAEVLLELERLRVVKEELTEEVSRLHKLLEQERSNKANGTASESHAKHHKDKQNKKKKI